MTGPYGEYIESGIDWLGKVPKGWRTKPLWSMFKRIKDVGHPDEPMLSVFRDYGVVAKDSRDNINTTAENRDIYQLVEPGWLVSNRMKAWQGSVGISALRGIVSGHYICFAPRHDEDSRYLNWLFRSSTYADGYGLQSRGVRICQAEIDNDLYRVMPVLLPPLEEQRAIADYLDRETARIDTLIEEQQHLIQLLHERRSAVVDRALSYGLDAGPCQTGNPWLPVLPVGWKVVPTKWLLSFGPSNGMSPEVGAVGDLKTLSLGAVRNGRVSKGADVTKAVDRTAVPGLHNLRLRANDVLLVRGNGNVSLVGRAGLVGPDFDDDEYIYPDLLIRLRVGARMLPSFFVWAFNSGVTRAQIEARARTAVGTFKIAAGDVRAIVLPLPPLEEQRRISTYLEVGVAKIDSFIAEAQRFIDLSRERRAALITAAVTGQIDVREMA